ncbi:MAG: LLM class F420-dependent oxidoreductase [Pseudomonadota bacterium]
MKLSVAMAFSQHTAPSFIKESAQLVEEMGFHGIWVPEHVLFFPAYASSYPYSDTGRIPGDPEGLLDPFTALTFVASCTERVRLGTGICLVPQRQPVYTAKMVADVDFLSSGRVDFGVGVGWLREEFENLGVDFSSRGALCDEYIDLMQALWMPGNSTFSGPTQSLQECHFNPKPIQSPHPPIYFGGESLAAMRRVAARGQGWYGYDLAPEDVGPKLETLAGLLGEAGRGLDDTDLLVGPNRHPVTAQTVAAYAAQGISQLVVPLGANSLEKLQQRGARLLEAL